MHLRWATCPNPGQKRAGLVAFLLFPFCFLVPKNILVKHCLSDSDVYIKFWNSLTCSYKILEQFNMLNVAFYNYYVRWNNLAEGVCSSFWIGRGFVRTCISEDDPKPSHRRRSLECGRLNLRKEKGSTGHAVSIPLGYKGKYLCERVVIGRRKKKEWENFVFWTVGIGQPFSEEPGLWTSVSVTFDWRIPYYFILSFGVLFGCLFSLF